MDAWPPGTRVLGGSMTLAQLNTQIAEQANSKLRSIGRQFAYMGHANAMRYVSFFVASLNRRTLQSEAFGRMRRQFDAAVT